MPRVLPLLILAASCWVSWRWLRRRRWIITRLGLHVRLDDWGGTFHNPEWAMNINAQRIKSCTICRRDGARSSEATRGR